MIGCFYGIPNEGMEKIVKHWNSKRAITHHLGKIGGNKFGDKMAEKYLSDMTEDLFGLPFNSNFDFTKPMLSRLTREINNVANNYKKKKIGNFKRYFYVPQAIADYSPASKRFYESVNLAVNYERNNMDSYLMHSQAVSSYVRKALVESGFSKKESKKVLRDLTKLEEQIMRGTDAKTENEFTQKYHDLFKRNEGKVINDYITLMEMNKSDFAKKKGLYNSNIVNAVTESRVLLDKMGKVMINGLDRMQNVVKLVYGSPLVPSSGRNYIKRIEDAKKSILNGMKKGGYLPHYLLGSLVEVNQKLKNFTETKQGRNVDRAMEDLVSKIETMVPDQAKGRNDQLNNVWSKNPFFILTQYSKDAIAFNKINAIQENYIPAMRRFQREDMNPQFIRSMREFIEDTFQISTKGMTERPNWVNASVRGILAAETIKSMGLSFTGALRNGASALYFFAEQGAYSALRAKGEYKRYQADLNKIEKEQGFQFTKSGKELIAEGLIPSSVNTSDIIFDPLTGKISYRDKGVLKVLDPAIDKAVGGSLVFHRFTENMTRKWMFRIAWIQAYEKLKGHSLGEREFRDSEQAIKRAASDDAEFKRMSTRFALKIVNKYAFEYSAHAKARGIGGIAPRGELDPNTGLPKMKSKDYAGALGELAFQFMHYPMSFLHLQSKILRGAKDAALSKQWKAPELTQALNFAGIAGMVELLSITTNLDLSNTLPNDSVKKIVDMKDYLTKDEKDLGHLRGLINDYTGPIIGDTLYWMNAMQMYHMPTDRLGQTLLGYKDYYADGQVPDWVGPTKKIDTQEKHEMFNRLSIAWSRFYTKDLPALQDGRGMDILRYELGWYPRSHLKQRRDWINKKSWETFGVKPFSDKKKKKKKRISASGAIAPQSSGTDALSQLVSDMLSGNV